MLATLFFLGLALLVAGVVFMVVLGIAGSLIGLLIKVLLLGLVAYVVIRIVSPRTAARLREKVENRSLPRL